MGTKRLTLEEVEQRIKKERDKIRWEIKGILVQLIPKVLNVVDLLATSEGRLQYQRIQPEIYEYELPLAMREKYDQSETVGQWSKDDWQSFPCDGKYPLGTLQEDGSYIPMYQSGIYNRKYALINKETGNIFEVNVSHVFKDPTIEYMGFPMQVNCLFLTDCWVSVTYCRERKLTETKYAHCTNLHHKVKQYFSSNFVKLKIARERACNIEPLTDDIQQLLKEDGFFDANGFPKVDLENTPYEVERYEETISFDDKFVVYQWIGNQKSIVGYLNTDRVYPKKPTVEITKVYSDPTMHFPICTIKEYQSYEIQTDTLVSYFSIK